MRKIFTLFSLFLIGKIAVAQDLSVNNITAPVSACALSANENVTIKVFNFGPTLVAGSTFNVSYWINAGAPVTEMVTLAANFNTNSTLTYTFVTQANVSIPGSYTFDASASVAGDVNPSNDTFTGYVVVNTAPSVGGTISGGTNVCTGSNAGALTLSGHTGNVLNWEYSVDGGTTWISISNTTTTQSYNNLTVPTLYRAQVQSGSCTPAFSSVASMTIDPVSVGGTVSGTATVCSGSNGATMVSSGRTGNIVRWQFSTDGGATWNNIANTTASQAYLNLTTTTRYRVEVQSGACASVFSSQAVITVSPPTVAGSVTGGTTVCSGSNSGNLTLAGHTGSVVRWEFSTDGGATWTNIANTTTTQSYLNLTATRWYRAQVKSGACAAIYSTIDSVVVTPATVAGTPMSSATVCSGTNSGVITLTGYVGTINFWEFSTDGGATYTNVANTTNTISYLNLTTTTLYRANVSNGACVGSNSSVATITVNPVSVGGTTAPNDTVCSGSNSGSITLSGQTGSIINWESSTDGVTWTTIANTTTTQNYLNIAATTYYRAVVKSGVCASANSSIDTITVDVPSVGGTISSSSNVCYGNNSGTLTLTGNTGNVVRWEYSIDGGINWNTISNTTNTHNYANITLTSIYRAVVQNGTCSQAISGTATLTVDPVSVGGTLNGSTTACGGSNSGTMDLINYIGTIQGWESSTDGGVTWTPIANTTATQNYLNVPTTTAYRVIVKSGVCSNDTSSIATITVDPPSVGGTLTMSDTVCASSNFGTLTLTGFTGTIQHWESSTDGGLTWITLANTSASQTYMNLAVSTSYRVNVKSGVCNATTSNTVTITVDAVPVGGTISGGTTVCDTVNSGTLSLTGSVGMVQGWESSTDGGLTWTAIANTTTSHSYTNLTDSTWFRAIVMSGICGSDTSTTAAVIVNPATVGGMVSMNDTVCTSSNSGTVYLSGQTGAVIGWEMSTDGGFNWSSVSNTSDSLNYINLTTTTSYRAIVKSGICSQMTSAVATITVDPLPAGGMISGGTTVCDTVNSGTLTLNSSVGDVQSWESSTDGGISWTSIVNNTTSHTYNNLTDTTWFRAIVMSGACGADTSSTAVVNINPATVAGMISASDTVCAGTNNGTLNLTGYTGMILGWEISTDGGFNWIPISNTTDSLVYNNLTVSTSYRAIVKSGICNSAYSTVASITVDAMSVAGTISGSMPGCEGSNGGTLTLSGYTGAISNWNSSTDGGMTWTSIANTTATQTYSNLTDTTWYNVVVQSGACSADTSASVVVIVYPKPVAMISADTVCAGNTTTFTNTSSISGGFIQFSQWDFGDGTNSLSLNPTHTYASAGTYSVSLLTTSNLGCLDTAMITVLVNALPSPMIVSSGPLEFCSGDSVMLSGAAGAFTYLWSTGATTQAITVTTAGTYAMTITDIASGCSASDSVTVTVNPSPVVFAGNDTTISLGGSIQLNASGPGVISWSWFPNTGLTSATTSNPMASPIETTTYQVIGTDINGCSDEDSIMITVINDFNVVISNLMTPNDDGYNDRWIIQNIENYPNTEVIVVNREGQEVFTSDSYDNNWDGTNTYGKPLPDGTYYYILKFADTTEEKIYKGSITILKQK
jgi:gliding motility-associated-like protein